MAFLTSKDGTLASARAVATNDGIPYVWNSGDVTTVPSNETKILAPDGTDGDLFGTSVSVGSGRIVVGAYLDDDNGSASGSAYIYDLDGNYITKITAPDGGSSDYFGYSVSVGSGRIVVGAYLEDESGGNSGSAYLYDLDGNYITKILASDGFSSPHFGFSVSVGSGRIVVGAREDDDNGTNSGSSYIYDLNGNYIAKILAPDGTDGDNFGTSVSVGSGRIVVGAYLDDDNGSASGSAYIYDLDGNYITKITAPNAESFDYFGYSVSVNSGKIIVGAYGDDDNGGNSGSAYLYDLDGNYITKILAPDGQSSDYFGYSVSVGSGRIVVGAIGYAFTSSTTSGYAYVFDLDGNYITKIVPSDGAADDRFGSSVSIGSGKIVVGSIRDDDDGVNSGSAYIYDTPQVYTIYDAIELDKGYL